MDEVADPAEIASDRDGGRQEITVDAACLGDSFDLVALKTVKVLFEPSDRRRQRTRCQEGRGGRCRKRSTRIRLANGGGLGSCIMAGRVFEYVSGDLTWCCRD